MTNEHIRKLREDLPDKIPLECHNCHYEWEYQGKNPFYAQCPKCKFQVNISKNRTDIEEEPEPDKKKPSLKEELENMTAGESVVIERRGDSNIMIMKDSKVIEGVEGLKPKWENRYWIRKEGVSRPYPILPKGLEKINELAKEDNVSFADEIIKLVDKKDNEDNWFDYLNAKLNDLNKKLEDFTAQGGI